MSAAKKVHGGLILAGGLLGLSLTVLVMGAGRGRATNAGLPGSAAAEFSLRDSTGTAHRLGEFRSKSLVLIVARRDAADFAKTAAEINQIRDTFAKDDAVRVVGLQYTADTGLLSATDSLPGVLDSHCPGLLTLQDADATVASAYRAADRPTAFVVDPTGVIRARVPLDHEGAAVAVAGTVSSLRPATQGFPGAQLPN